MFVFGGPLKNKQGKLRGRIDGECTTTSAPGPAAEQRQLCVVILTALGEPGAEIEMQGVGRVQAEDVDFGITGGTREFQDAGGRATFDFTRRGRVVITFRVIP